MIDLVKLELQAGDGGNGRVAFRREKYVPKGGPAGGNGGDGGNVVLRGNRHLGSLEHLIGEKRFVAGRGQIGGSRKMKGARGQKVVIEVPLGTKVWLLAENELSRVRRRRYGLEFLLNRDEVGPEKYYLTEIGQAIPPRVPDQMEPILREEEIKKLEGKAVGSEGVEDGVELAQLKRRARLLKKVLRQSSDSLKKVDFRQLPKQELIEIVEHEQEVVLCQGGFGGRGNTTFKGPENTTPLEAEYGTTGEKKMVILEQHLLADVGLVGLPNAGKSTLMSVLTDARPKTANYPFTTLEPHLGVMRLGGQSAKKELVLADIPGLIEGASQGKGLGHAFLRHIEHCRLLVFVLFLPEVVIFDEDLSVAEKAECLREQWRALRAELGEYGHELVSKKSLVVVNKLDLYSAELRQEIKQEIKQVLAEDEDALLISAITQDGVEELQRRLVEAQF